MQSIRPSTDSKINAKPRLPTPARGLGALGKGKRRRLAISDPIGPIKNSRGPDFVRSETLTIVPGIKDCGSDESLSSGTPDAAKKAARRISASFNPQGRLVSNSTVAESTVNATTSYNSPVSLGSSQGTRKASPSFLPVASKKPIASSSTLNLFPRGEPLPQDENTPPSGEDLRSNKPLMRSQIPRSRTMSVLHDLKTSMSRPSPNSRSVNSRKFESVSHKASDSSITTSIPQSSSRIRLPRQSLTSLARSSGSSSPEPQPQPPVPQIYQISTAQPSAYWSGRFVALHDRFASEDLAANLREAQGAPTNTSPQKSSTPDRYPPRTSSMNPGRLPNSTTTSSLTTAPFPNNRKPPPNDEEARCLRIFARLDGFCTTSEARRSLHSFQQAYARRVGRPELLPQGGSMEDKSLMNKLFGGRKSKAERRSMSGLRESSSSRAAKKAGNAAGGRGKRLTIY